MDTLETVSFGSFARYVSGCWLAFLFRVSPGEARFR